MKPVLLLVTFSTVSLLLRPAAVLALDPSRDLSQYAHTAWTVRNEFSVGTIFAMAQTPDGYLWLGSEFGLFRFDGVRFTPWQPPAGQFLPSKPYSLLVTRDGTLWIGTYGGLVTWNGSKLTGYPEIEGRFVTSLLEDREGIVWAGIMGLLGTPTGRLCAIRSGSSRCYGEDGAFGSFVWNLCEDGAGTLWAGAESGVWRWKPGPPKRYPIPGMRVADLSTTDDGRLLIAISYGGLKRLVGRRVESFPIRSAINRNALFQDRDVNSNKLLRDRDGGLWIGTRERGLIHIHHDRTDVFTKSDGLSGNIIAGLFEDREGTIWVSTNGGFDRFRELPATTISAKQGLSSDDAASVLATTDGSIWIGGHEGLTRWKNGQTTIFRKADGLPDDVVQSLFQDDHGRVWAFTGHGLAYFNDGRFVALKGAPSEEVYSITGGKAGDLWLSGNRGLSHLRDRCLVEHFPWSALGRREPARVVLFDRQRDGVWLSFGLDGGVIYFKDGQVRASYSADDGLGKGHVPGLRLDRDGVLWAATDLGGLSRIKDGRIATLTTRNGLPCDTIHWSIEDDDRSFWLYTACGLVRIARTELDGWIADSWHRVETTVWGADDAVLLRSASPAKYNPPVAKSSDGKLWFIAGDGVQVVDPHHLADNKLPPPVHVEQIIADLKSYWQNLPGQTRSNVHLPPRTRDLQITYTALSLVAPEKVQFKYKLEGQDQDWKPVVNDRKAQYTNLARGTYRFRVIASNNSGVWNEQGDTLEFLVDPAYYQTNWFRAMCAGIVLVLLWAAYQLRVRQLTRQFNLALDARVAERTRIGRELHDTLLQSFQGVLLKFQSVLKLLPERPIEARHRLERALDRATEAITEARDAVQGLRSSALYTNDLADSIARIGDELSGDALACATIHVHVEGVPRDLKPMVRDEVYRISCEALRNAVRHAQARHIEVKIQFDESHFRLRVRDDGKGMAQETVERQPPPGHFGLHGMRERAEIIGARIDVWSKLDSGTAIDLSVPANVAYSTISRWSSLFHIFSKQGPDNGAMKV
jgi:signal transduction histidine kinase/ligand-binding sensor domain-containing protein